METCNQVLYDIGAEQNIRPIVLQLLVEYGVPRSTAHVVQRIARDAVYMAVRQAWELNK